MSVQSIRRGSVEKLDCKNTLQIKKSHIVSECCSSTNIMLKGITLPNKTASTGQHFFFLLFVPVNRSNHNKSIVMKVEHTLEYSLSLILVFFSLSLRLQTLSIYTTVYLAFPPCALLRSLDPWGFGYSSAAGRLT